MRATYRVHVIDGVNFREMMLASPYPVGLSITLRSGGYRHDAAHTFVETGSSSALVRIEPQVLNFLAQRAQAKGTTVNDLLNALLKKDIELIEAA
jgi:hypothetical protein